MNLINFEEMSEKFKLILKSKSAEQLINMNNNKKDWDNTQLQMIQDEISNRGLEIFEEPTEWNEEEMKQLDLENPKSEFEKNIAFITNETISESTNFGRRLTSQILSISSIIISFISFYFLSPLGEKVASIILFCLLISIGGLIIFVKKLYITSVVISILVMLTLLLLVFLNWSNLLLI